MATIPGSDTMLYPKCSRQGDLLALSGETNGPRAVGALLRSGRRVWEDLGSLALPLQYPNWTRKGDSFCGLVILTSSVECFSLATRRPEPLAEARELTLKSWVGFPWMGLDANDMPLVVADRSTTALYSLDWEAP